MKTSKILKAKTFVCLTKNEMVKIVGGENGSGNGNQNASTPLLPGGAIISC